MVLKPRNPFSTAAISSGRIQFKHPGAGGWFSILEELAANRWLGEVVGPHGTGKTTFLLQLSSILNALEVDVDFVRYRVDRNGKIHNNQFPSNEEMDEGSSILPPPTFETAASAAGLKRPERCRIIDGFEQMPWIQQKAVIWKSRWAREGLIVSAHCTRGLPRLLQTESSLQLLKDIAKELLVTDAGDLIDLGDISTAWTKSQGNTREALFLLYDVWEKRSIAKKP